MRTLPHVRADPGAVCREAPEIKVGKVDVDEEPELAMEHRIVSIPSLVLFRDGKLEKTAVGAMPLAALENWIR